MSRRLTLGSILLLVGFATAAADAADKLVLPLNLTVEAGQRERVDALVQFPLPPGTPASQPRVATRENVMNKLALGRIDVHSHAVRPVALQGE